MKLYFHKDPLGNFGDDLNPWLWERLLPGVFDGHCYHDPRLRKPEEPAPTDTLFVGIGTLLNQNVPNRAKKLIFGSGTGYGGLPSIDDTWEFRSVRGPITAQLLGLDLRLSICDPAILLRTLSLPKVQKRYKFSFMPHCSSSRLGVWQSICEQIEVHFIDPASSVETVLTELLATETLITEAMHGAIVADALRVPWIAVSSHPQIVAMKWEDWSRSLGITHEPESLPAIWPAGKGSSLTRRLIAAGKRKYAVRRLNQIRKTGRPKLSEEGLLQEATERLLENVERVRRECSAAAVG
jgi:succinoglycan biosynthesis protein ExoV